MDKITKKQQEIVKIVFIFRFINSKQIQKLLNHKDHRRINSWLKDLVEKGYLERDFKLVFGSITKPAVYFLSTKGRSFIREKYHFKTAYLTRLKEDKKRSKSFRIRCQLMTDFFLLFSVNKIERYTDFIDSCLVGGVKTVSLNEFQFFSPAFYEKLNYPFLLSIRPDAYLHFRGDKVIKDYFFLIIDSYIPKMMLRKKIEKLFEAYEEEDFKKRKVNFLYFNIICPNNVLIIYLKKIIPSFFERYYNSVVLFINLITRNEMYKHCQYPEKKIKIVNLFSSEY